MSTLLTPRSDGGRGCPGTEPRLHEPRRAADGGLTLEDVVCSVWEDLSVRGLAACPVCGDDMSVPGDHRRPATCRGCGSELR